METNNEYLTIPNFTTYETNIHGIVRNAKTKNVISVNKARVCIRADDTKRRTWKSVEQLVQIVFYPHLNNSRNQLYYYKDRGFVENKIANHDYNDFVNLIQNDIMFRINTRKNYKNEIRFQFKGMIESDTDVKCLLRSDKRIVLYRDEETALDEMENGDEIYYFNIHAGKHGFSYDTELLEHVIMAKYYYIESIEVDFDYEEEDEPLDMEHLYKQYFQFDFDEEFDRLEKSIGATKRQGEKQQKNVKITNKGYCGLDAMPESDIDDYEKEKARDAQRKEQRRLIIEQKQRDHREEQKQMLMMEASKMDRVIQGKLHQSFKKLNEKFGTNIYDLESLDKWCKASLKQSRQRKEQDRRQKEKDIKRQQAKLKEAEMKLAEMSK